jgi:hypothetical protein
LNSILVPDRNGIREPMNISGLSAQLPAIRCMEAYSEVSGLIRLL